MGISPLLFMELTSVVFWAYFMYWMYYGSSPASRQDTSPPEVKTTNGVLRGRRADAPQGGDVEEFLGIPFAKPPLGSLRYADPEPLDKFAQDPYDATDVRYSCMQFKDTTFGDFPGSTMWNAPNTVSEDCLYLNIWVPRPRKEKRTVLVWIYGGGFFSGSNALWVYDGKALAMHTDAIVCSFNYRVGTFGYLATGDGRIKGNFGMKDQVLALQWIRDNIAAFGGDPDSVTIFGESSGASSAGLHLMSPYSELLFNRAIFESGSPDAHWAFMSKNTARERSRKLFAEVGCTDDDTVVDCMRKLPAQFIMDREWVDARFMVFPWAPTVDDDFLVDTPYNLLQAGKFQRKDTLLGVNKDEGTYWLLYALPGFSKDGPSLHNYSMFLAGVDQVDFDLSYSDRQKVKTLYSPFKTNDLAANRDALDKVVGDRSFTCPTKELTDMFAANGLTTYFYYLTHRSAAEVWPPWMGVIHAAEIPFVFGMPMNASRGYPAEEVQFAETIMSYWINFARRGDPNGPGLPHWPQYTGDEKKYLEWKGPNNFVQNNTLRDKYCKFWSEINVSFNDKL